MPEPQPVPINIGNVSDGAMVEAFEMELRKVLRNIADPTTPATSKREIVLRLSMKPKEDRMQIDTQFICKSTLAPITPHTSRIFVGKGTDGEVYAFADDPRQQILFTPPKAEEPQNVVTFAPASGK